MKFKIQEFPGPTREAETEVYFSLHVSTPPMTSASIFLRASNVKGQPGQVILSIREDGKLYRPQITPINGLTLIGGHIEHGQS